MLIDQSVYFRVYFRVFKLRGLIKVVMNKCATRGQQDLMRKHRLWFKKFN